MEEDEKKAFGKTLVAHNRARAEAVEQRNCMLRGNE